MLHRSISPIEFVRILFIYFFLPPKFVVHLSQKLYHYHPQIFTVHLASSGIKISKFSVRTCPRARRTRAQRESMAEIQNFCMIWIPDTTINNFH